ncbi:MAG: ABC transporter ATP-binding protein [Thermoplasmata archaeon]
MRQPFRRCPFHNIVILKYTKSISAKVVFTMANDPIITVSDLTKVYGDIRAVDGVSFEVNRGTIFSFLGPNGAGKTTTVEMMEGLRTPTSGKIRIFGVDVTKDNTSIRHRVGVLPQEFQPFDRLKAPEAIRYFAGLFDRKMTKEEVSALIETVGLNHRADTIAMKLSGGEKKRLGLALALVGDPELLFLDEPTTGLDAQARRSLWKLLERLREEGKTIFLTTHYLDEAERLSDEIVVIHKGKEIARGSPMDLIDRYGGGISILLRNCGEESMDAVKALGFGAEKVRQDVKVNLDPEQSVREAIRRLDSSGVQFKDLITIEPTLEDAFLKMVGGEMVEGVLKK